MFHHAIRQKRPAHSTDGGPGSSDPVGAADPSGDLPRGSSTPRLSRPSPTATGYGDTRRRCIPTSETLIEEADEFLHACYTELNRITELPERRRAVAAAIEADGTYDHTFAELEYGVRVAWRNSSRCIGRLYWRTLRLRDRRADADRYDLLPTVAANLGLDTGSDRTLWRDRALVELNLAVLHSYEQAGVTIADHHTESHRFLTHLDKEARAGRGCPAEWSWIVPPLSSGSTAVFHRYYEQVDVRPNFVRH